MAVVLNNVDDFKKYLNKCLKKGDSKALLALANQLKTIAKKRRNSELTSLAKAATYYARACVLKGAGDPEGAAEAVAAGAKLVSTKPPRKSAKKSKKKAKPAEGTVPGASTRKKSKVSGKIAPRYPRFKRSRVSEKTALKNGGEPLPGEIYTVTSHGHFNHYPKGKFTIEKVKNGIAYTSIGRINCWYFEPIHGFFKKVVTRNPAPKQRKRKVRRNPPEGQGGLYHTAAAAKAAGRAMGKAWQQASAGWRENPGAMTFKQLLTMMRKMKPAFAKNVNAAGYYVDSFGEVRRVTREELIAELR